MNGIVRKMDYMRRLILPKEMTDLLNLKPNDLLEIFLNKDSIVIKPYYSEVETYQFIKNFVVTNFEGKDYNRRIDEQALINITEELKESINRYVIQRTV